MSTSPDRQGGQERYDADVVIAGSGIAGALIACALRQAGARVLMLEAAGHAFFDAGTGRDDRSPLLARYYETAAKGPNAPYPDSPEVPHDDFVQGGGGKFLSGYTRIVGGTMYHWLGTTLRFVPNDFRIRSAYGVGKDWPIDYEALEDWYKKAEDEIGVSGDSVADADDRKGIPYPMPPIRPSYSDGRIRARTMGMRFEDLPVEVRSTPQGRNSVPYHGRPACAGSGSCVPICPIQAKYDATVHLKRALRSDGPGTPVRLELGWVVTQVHVEADGRVSYLEGLRADTRERVTARAKLYVLAMNAVEIPRVLLYSASRGTRVANGSGYVGCFLMDHDVKIAHGLADEPLYQHRGPVSTAGIESLSDGPFRGSRAAFRVQIQNTGTAWAEGSPFTTLDGLLKQGIFGEDLRRHLGWNVSREVELDALLERLPEKTNRVTLADQLDGLGLPRAVLTYSRPSEDPYTAAGAQAFERLARAVLEQMGATAITIEDGFRGAGHIMGTFRMGPTASDSVVDSFGRTHDHDNLFLVGSGTFPTVGTANPTLTIAALALRSAAEIGRQLSP